MTSAPEIRIRLAGEERYAPGDVVEGSASIQADDKLGRVELSVLWYTAGKGSTENGVVYFEVVSDGADRSSIRHPFSVRLPPLPWSYEGTVLAIHWVVRVRVCALLGEDLVVDHPFQVVGGRSIV